MVDNVSQGVIPTNDHDPTGQNPKPEHFFSSNINFAATGSKRNDYMWVVVKLVYH